MNGRLPRRPVERYGDHAGASGINVAHAPCGRYGGLACRGGRYGALTLQPRGALPYCTSATVMYEHTSVKK